MTVAWLLKKNHSTRSPNINLQRYVYKHITCGNIWIDTKKCYLHYNHVLVLCAFSPSWICWSDAQSWSVTDAGNGQCAANSWRIPTTFGNDHIIWCGESRTTFRTQSTFEIRTNRSKNIHPHRRNCHGHAKHPLRKTKSDNWMFPQKIRRDLCSK